MAENQEEIPQVPMGDPAPSGPALNNNDGPLTAAKAAALVDKEVG